jgi:hypothetical protein
MSMERESTPSLPFDSCSKPARRASIQVLSSVRAQDQNSDGR